MMGMQAMYDLAAPQARYLELIAQGGYVEAMEGLGLSFNRANTEYVLRHADEFSSRIDMSLGNVRPLIPLNVDPPQHSKYRKLLDPLFAPKRMDEQEEDITRRVNGFIDAFIDRGECNFTEEFAELFPSSVFLGPDGPARRTRCACSSTCATASCTQRSTTRTRWSTWTRARR